MSVCLCMCVCVMSSMYIIIIIISPLLPLQPILSETLLDQYRENKSAVPPGMSPDKYLEVMVNLICQLWTL